MKKTAIFGFMFALLFLSLGRTMPTTAYVATYSVTSDLTDRSYVSSISGSQLDAALRAIRGNNNGLIGYGQSFVNVGSELGINPLYIAAHAAWETGWGTSLIWSQKNNPFGYGAFDRCPYSCAFTFASKEDGIRTGMTYIKRDYLVSGGRYYNGPNLQGMNIYYATDQNWKTGIAQIMNSLQNKIGVTPLPTTGRIRFVNGRSTPSVDNNGGRANVQVCADNLPNNTVYVIFWRSGREWRYSQRATGSCVTFFDMDGAGPLLLNTTYYSAVSLNDWPSKSWGTPCATATNSEGLCDSYRR